eukprot:5457793-Pyramimonas_sp.AAC.1
MRRRAAIGRQPSKSCQRARRLRGAHMRPPAVSPGRPAILLQCGKGQFGASIVWATRSRSFGSER